VETITQEVAAYAHGRVPRPVRLRQIELLARELFEERGYTAASMDELARRAGVSKPVIYDLVGSKSELFRLLMRRTAEELGDRVRNAVGAKTDAYERLRAGSEAWFGFVADNRATWAAFLAGEDLPTDDEAAAIRSELTTLVARLLAEDAISMEADASALLLDVLAHLVNGSFEAVGGWWAHHPWVEPTAVADLCTRALLPGLTAIAADVPPDWSGAEDPR
jgi:AcrR family transcriptional regulator